MKSWSKKHKCKIDTPKEIIDFFDEIEEVCVKHGLSISHEDGHGAFEIEKFSSDNIEWLKSAYISF